MSIIESMHNHTHNEEATDISEIIDKLLENKLLIAIITSISLACGVFYASRQIPQFQASILIQFEDSGRGMVLGAGLLNQGFSGFNHGNEAAIQSALIKSRVVLNPVCQSLGLDVSATPTQGFFKHLISPSRATIEINKLELSEPYVNKTLDLFYDKSNHVVLSDDQQNILVEGNTSSLLQSKDKSIKLKVSKIHAAIGNHFSVMKSSTEHIVQGLASRINIVDLGGRQPIGIVDVTLQDANPQRAVDVLNQIAKTILERDAEKKSLEASKTLAFLYQQLPITKESLEKAELKLNQYRANSGKIDFKFQSRALLGQFLEIDTKLAELKLTKEDMKQRYTMHHPSLNALMQKISSIEQQRAEMEKDLKNLPSSDQIALNLSRDVSVKTALYTTLLRKIQELKVIKAGTISDLNILSLAKLPESPLPTRKKVTYLGSVLFGLILSVMIIYTRKLISPKIEDPRWTEQHFNIANLAIIPYSKEQKDYSDTLGSLKQIPLLAHTNPRNLSIEALRSLRTSLQINLSCANNNIVSILGISPGVGKTFISTNLAYLLATAEKRVLLIDADLRRGTAHHYFNVSAAPGLTELINGTTTVESVLLPTTHKNLTLLPRGDYPADPSEILSSARFKGLIHELSLQYDIVIIDTAPVLLVTDSILIGSISTTNYLVLGSNAHTTGEVEIAIKRLQGAGITVNGSIFNFHNVRSQRNPYYYRYYSYNYYADDNATTKDKKSRKRKKGEVAY
ncbi:MAG: polysaccharide biosynthesis tyrosine autokinase [Legionellaceae bacterium]|nr:polysaccharide biosynthesis tyrosine autokinase [Legionellaceae bacterium]